MLDKRGQITQSFNLFTIMIVMFLAVVLFGGLIYVTGLINTQLHNIGLQNEVNSGNAGYTNMTKAADNTFGQMNSGIQALRLVALCLIFAMILGTIITNAMVKMHPVFFFLYVFITLLAVLLAAPISNAYESLLKSNLYDGLLQSFTGSNWILLNLPLVIAVVGILGTIFIFVGIIRNSGEVSL